MRGWLYCTTDMDSSQCQNCVDRFGCWTHRGFRYGDLVSILDSNMSGIKVGAVGKVVQVHGDVYTVEFYIGRSSVRYLYTEVMLKKVKEKDIG